MSNRVDLTILADGKMVSTVKLSAMVRDIDDFLLDPLLGRQGGLDYETMVFPNENDAGDIDCQRYATLEEAKAGHQRMVQKWQTVH